MECSELEERGTGGRVENTWRGVQEGGWRTGGVGYRREGAEQMAWLVGKMLNDLITRRGGTVNSAGVKDSVGTA
jgi:hypothetical protein